MKKILGLDLGVGSIGWSVIQKSENQEEKSAILGMGSRIVPLSTDDADQYMKGKAITKNHDRTVKRTIRKGLDRYQLRRSYLLRTLEKLGMKPTGALWKLPMCQLWQLRADAAVPGKQLSLEEIGRVLCHLNQRRGYRHSKSDETDNKQQSDYVSQVNARYQEAIQEGKTVGQYLYSRLQASEQKADKGSFYTYRIKEKVFPRQAYQAEFDAIMEVQKGFYPSVLTEDIIDELRNQVIFYQRPLKSCKHLVALCEFEKRQYVNPEGKIVSGGPKVAPRTSPLFQVCKVWESINNVVLTNRKNEKLYPSREQKEKMFDYMQSNPKLTATALMKIMGLTKTSGWSAGENVGRGLEGNKTRVDLLKALEGLGKDQIERLLSFTLETEPSKVVDTETGEILPQIKDSFEKEPLYRLWHLLYSVEDKEDLFRALRNQFGIDDEAVLDRLYKLDFVKPGYANKSAKSMRRILPFLQQGYMYSDACAKAGFRHSESLNKEEKEQKTYLEQLPIIKKNELRQPVVEKILNQMVHVVNGVYAEYGRMDEIHIEMARELKQSQEQRSDAWSSNGKQEKENKRVAGIIQSEYGLYPSRVKVEKYKLWEEAEHRCMYCGRSLGAGEFLKGIDAEVEHIIPRSLYFDNGFSNKVCACRDCNAKKGNQTAYDFMVSMMPDKLEEYEDRIAKYLEEKRISRRKRDYLLMKKEDIPQDFIERQLRQSQYIARKAAEMLGEICADVVYTGGGITALLRHVWGYDNILHDLNFTRFKDAGLTETYEVEHKGQIIKRERIMGWSKRSDHRHHAIDALVIACTSRSVIQKINTLSASSQEIHKEISAPKGDWEGRKMLDQWILEQPHFSLLEVQQKAAGIMVSFKAGKKVASWGRRYIRKNGKRVLVQKNILVPRGALSEESVYGQIQRLVENQPLKELFTHPETIVKQHIRRLVEKRIADFGGDSKKALASVKKKPIYIHDGKDELTYASCYRKEIVIKYPVSAVLDSKANKEKLLKTIDSVVDGGMKSRLKLLLERFNYNVSELMKEGVYWDDAKTIPIQTIRCFTGLSAVEPVRVGPDGEPEAFVKPGNNHHVAIYEDASGNLQEHVVTFWSAAERKKKGLPVVIKRPYEIWERIDRGELSDLDVSKLPARDWVFKESMQQNEMFVLGMTDEEFSDAIRLKDYAALAEHLYRVQKLAKSDYYFRRHTETTVETGDIAKAKAYFRVNSLNSWMQLYPKKVIVNHIGIMSGI